MTREFDAEMTIAEVALDRARVLAPVVLLAVGVALVISEGVHVALSGMVVAFNAITIATLGALNFLLFTRRVPVQRWRLVSMILFWSPVLGTFVSQYSSHSAVLVSIVQLEMATAAIILDTRLVIWSFVAADAMWIPLCIRDGGESAGMFITGTLGAQVSAAVMQILMRRSFLQVHRLRHNEVENAGELARQLAELRDSKAEQAKLFDQLQHAQRMDAVGTLAAGVAHDMNNVLASIMSMSSLLSDVLEDEEHRDDLDQIIQSAERGAELTRGLLAFSRRGQYRNEPIRFGELVHGVASLLRRTLPKAIDIVESGHLGELCVRGDSSQLSQAIVNLGLNAADAMNGAGTLELGAVIEDLDADDARALNIPVGRYVALRVVDTGTGMDAGTRMRVFEPFFTTKPMGKGTGLGLALVWGTIQGHGGTVTVDSELGRGSTFTVHLPLSAERAPEVEAPTRRSRPVLAQKASTVLVIDDEPTIRTATTRLLERLGHHVLTAGDGAEGLRVFDEAEGAIDLVILDMGMPVMGGADCFERLRERSQVPVLIATGYALEEEAQALVARGAALLEKPFASAVLICEIERLIGSGSHSRGSRDVSEISSKPGAIVTLRASQEGNHERANESEDPGHRAAVSVGSGR